MVHHLDPMPMGKINEAFEPFLKIFPPHIHTHQQTILGPEVISHIKYVDRTARFLKILSSYSK
jgi:hypothetical protein